MTTTVLHEFFMPTVEMDPEAVATHGYSKAVLEQKNAKPFDAEAAERMLKLLRGCKGLLAHNVKHDREVLEDQLALLKPSMRLPSTLKFICTQAMAKQHLNLVGTQTSLQAVYQRLFQDAEMTGWHQAEVDATAPAQIWAQLKHQQAIQAAPI